MFPYWILSASGSAVAFTLLVGALLTRAARRRLAEARRVSDEELQRRIETVLNETIPRRMTYMATGTAVNMMGGYIEDTRGVML